MAKRIAISMPEPMFKEMERARRSQRKDRSAWLQEAVAERLHREQRARDIAAYVRSYDEYPENEDDALARFLAAASKIGPKYDDEWPEAPR